MGKKFIVRKININKRTKQPSITLPKKKIKVLDPTIKFGEDLFVRIELVRRKNGK